jgi:ABC-type phosphate/phosphonate transport system substrate-binding protein
MMMMMVMMMMMMISSSSSSSSSKDQHNSTQNVAFSFYPSRNKGERKNKPRLHKRGIIIKKTCKIK